MLPKYNDFLLESCIINLLLEGTLDASPEFLERLNMISSKSDIAYILYNKFLNGVEVNKNLSQNYIDITDKDDTISFLPDNKSDKLEYSDSRYLAKGRGEIKIGRFAKSLMTDKVVMKDLKISKVFTDKEYEDFVNLYKSSNVKSENKFELVEGEDILKYYHENSYAYQKGQLGNSCMKKEYCQDYFGIYVENPKTCNLLVYLNSRGEVLGRAIVWKVSKAPCDAEYFMDRIYTSSDSDIIKFKNYANEKGWMIKYKQNCDINDSYFFEYKGELVLGEVKVKLQEFRFDYYPFVDTLSYLNDGYISNISSAGSEQMNDTDGTISMCFNCNGSGVESVNCEECDGVGSTECEKCDATGKKDDDSDKNCKKCDGEGFIECKECSGDGDIQGDCEECVGVYKSTLKEIFKHHKDPKIKDLAAKELERIKSEKKDKKKKK
jgi:hypothetical protein